MSSRSSGSSSEKKTKTKRIQFNAGFNVDSTSYYQKVTDKNKGTVKVIENDKPLSGSSSVHLETRPYKLTVERSLSPKGQSSDPSKSSHSAASSPPSSSPTSEVKKNKDYDTSQLGI